MEMTKEFRTKGKWKAIPDNTQEGWHYICERCNFKFIPKPKVKEVLMCKCDIDDSFELPIPSCKKISAGSCHGCGTPCCQENA